MDTYSYISENGTVRQIEDLIAKAKNEEQDTDIAANRTAINALSVSVGQSLKKKTAVLPYSDITANDRKDYLKKRVEEALQSGEMTDTPSAAIIPGGWYGRSYGWTQVVRQNRGSCVVTAYLGSEISNGFYNVDLQEIEVYSTFIAQS